MYCTAGVTASDCTCNHEAFFEPRVDQVVQPIVKQGKVVSWLAHYPNRWLFHQDMSHSSGSGEMPKESGAEHQHDSVIMATECYTHSNRD